MSTSASFPGDLITRLQSSLLSKIPADFSESDLPSLSQRIYPDTSYTDNEKVGISQWLTTSSRLATPDEDEAKHAERLGSLNIHLSTRTTLLGSKPSVADLVLFHRLSPTVKAWSAVERTGEKGYHHIVRYIDFVQNASLFGLSLSPADKVEINPNDVRFVHKPKDPREEKERKKKEKAAAETSQAEGQKPLVVGRSKGQEDSNNNDTAKTQDSPPQAKAMTADDPARQTKPRKAQKEKPAKQFAQPPKETPLSPSLIDLRIGHILRAIPHPNADSLYVSTIACGDPPGTDNTTLDPSTSLTVRTVCSGLNGLIPLSELQDRKIIAVCNLKPVTMRGIKSAAMVLAASPRSKDGVQGSHEGPVELVVPPEGAQAGERVCFEGWEGEPEGVLNPKKKIWEMLQPGFTTTEGLEVGFEAGGVEVLKGAEGLGQKAVGVKRLVTKRGGVCTVKSLRGATVR
ncbi:G4 quadruplex nucleic acid binding protein [Lecanora helva]